MSAGQPISIRSQRSRTSTRALYDATHPAPERSWWADPEAQRDRDTFCQRLNAERARMASSKDGLLSSEFVVGGEKL